MAQNLELLGYAYSHHLNDNKMTDLPISYDENGFIIIDKTYMTIMFKDSDGNRATIFIHQNEKTDKYYQYSIQVNETAGVASGGIGSGDVKININDGVITSIVVDGVENGCLRDMYNDCFNIKPDMYMHIINKNYNSEN